MKRVVATFVDGVRNIFRRTPARSSHSPRISTPTGASGLPEDPRRDPRPQPVIIVPVYDRKEPENHGIVLDVSQNGLQVMGLQTEVGERRTLILDAGCILGEAGSTANQYVCWFQAECRWVRVDGNGDSVAGFRIKVISLRSLDVMRELVRSISLATN